MAAGSRESETEGSRKVAKCEETEETVCAICLHTPERPTFTQPCFHGPFCFKHIDRWIGVSRSCPMCKREIHAVLFDQTSQYDYTQAAVITMPKGEEGDEVEAGFVSTKHFRVTCLFPGRRRLYDAPGVMQAWVKRGGGVVEPPKSAGVPAGVKGVEKLFLSAFLRREIIAMTQNVGSEEGGAVHTMLKLLDTCLSASGTKEGAAFLAEAAEWLGVEKAAVLVQEIELSHSLLPTLLSICPHPRPTADQLLQTFDETVTYSVAKQ